MSLPSDETDYVNKFIDKIYTVLDKYKTYLDIKEIYKTEDSLLNMFPCITIEFDSYSEDWSAAANQKTISCVYQITYYYSEFDETAMRIGLRKGMNKLITILRENWRLDGYTPNLGSHIQSAVPYVLARGDDVLCGGIITLICQKKISITIVR